MADPDDAMKIINAHFDDVTPEEFAARASVASHGDTLEKRAEEPNILDAMRELVRKGFPIFTGDYEALFRDIIRAQYHMARAQVTNPYLAFPYQITPITGIRWLIEADDFGMGELEIHDVNTTYKRGDDTNGNISTVSVYNWPDHGFSRLSDGEIIASRELVRKFCPE